MIRLVNGGKPDDKGVIATFDDAPYVVSVLYYDGDPVYGIVNTDTEVVEAKGRAHLLTFFALAESYEDTYRDFMKAGSIKRMNLDEPEVPPFPLAH